MSININLFENLKPGTVINDGFFIDCCNNSGFILALNEASASGNTKFRGKFQEAEAVNKNKRMYPHHVLDENVKKLMECVKARGLVGELDHPCLQNNDFRVLTSEGWKEFIDIKVGDFVWSRVDGKAVLSKVNGIIDEPYDGPAYEIKGRHIDCTFTPGHRFVLENRNKQQVCHVIKEIFENRSMYSHHSIPKTATWVGNKSTKFSIPGVKNAATNKSGVENDIVFDTMSFMKLLGLYLSEGNINRNVIFISQKNSYGRKLLKEVLPTIHPELKWTDQKNGFYTSDVRLVNYFKSLGNCYEKYIPKEIKELDSKYLEELIYWFAIGDGRIQKSQAFGETAVNVKESLTIDSTDRLDMGTYSRINVFSVSKKLVEDLHECLVKTGRAGSRTVIIPKKDYEFAGRIIKAESKHPLYQLHIGRSKNIHLHPKFLRINQVHHKGQIYCLTVDHGNFYMEMNGKSFWTGNSDSIIHFEKASHVITKLWWEGNSLMGEGEVLNTPHGRILKSLINDGVRVGISSRGVGNGKVDEDGILVIGESYKLITFDAVADPSTFAAFQEKVVKKENYDHKELRPEKKVNKEALIAALGGLVKEHSSKLGPK